MVKPILCHVKTIHYGVETMYIEIRGNSLIYSFNVGLTTQKIIVAIFSIFPCYILLFFYIHIIHPYTSTI